MTVPPSNSPGCVAPLLYISPHLDDAVLSVGGTIAAQSRAGRSVIVATVVTADPAQGVPRSALAQRYWLAWGSPATPFADRCVEDAAALAGLGARPVHLGLQDCSYRFSPSGRTLYDSMESLFSGSPDPEDTEFLEAVEGRVGELIDRERPEIVYTALTVGRHVDHVCVNHAVRKAAAARDVPVLLWEDLPYANGSYPPDNPDTVSMTLARSGWSHLSPLLSRIDLEPKIEATLCYVSQIRDLFGSPEECRSVLSNYARTLDPVGAAERFWADGR